MAGGKTSYVLVGQMRLISCKIVRVLGDRWGRMGGSKRRGISG